MLLLSACSANTTLNNEALTTGTPTTAINQAEAALNQSSSTTINENNTFSTSLQPEASNTATLTAAAAAPNSTTDTAAAIPNTENVTSTAAPNTTATNNPEIPNTTPTIDIVIPADNENTANVLAPETSISCRAPVTHTQQRTLQLINEARSQPRNCGADSFAATTALSWNTKLLQAAGKHSSDMTQHNFFDHTGSDGSSVSSRVDETGYEWRAVGENIAAGQRSAREAIAGWLNSPGHCRNLMSPNFTEVAVTCVEDDGADYSQYWTNVLASPR